MCQCFQLIGVLLTNVLFFSLYLSLYLYFYFLVYLVNSVHLLSDEGVVRDLYFYFYFLVISVHLLSDEGMVSEKDLAI